MAHESATSTSIRTLSEEGIEHLKSLKIAIASAKVENTDELGNAQYSNKSLDKFVLPLLKSVGLEHQGYTAWKMTRSIPIKNRTGPEHVIPISVLDNTSPSLTPGGPLKPGTYIYHDGPVELEPSVNCLFVGTPISKPTGG